jgi:UPF0716 protein FxsA
MRLASHMFLFGFLAVFLWLAAEIAVFFYVVDQIGLLGAILLSLAASYIGVSLLRRVGLAVRQSLFDLLRRSESGFAGLQPGLRDGAIGVLGALLLIVPGFLSDGLGLALALASAGFWLRGPQTDKASTDGVVDLSPNDWHSLDTAGKISHKPQS